MVTTVAEQPLVNKPLIRAFIGAALVYLVVALLAGLLMSLQFLARYPFPTIELLAPGRMRFVHTNLAGYGMLVNALLAGTLWAIPRLTGRPIQPTFGWIVFWFYQALVVLSGAALVTGGAQGVEWGETPVFLDPLISVAFLLILLLLLPPIIGASRRGPLYVSLWYFTAAGVWTVMNYVMGNFLPEYVVAGTAGAAINGVFIHDFVGLLVTPLGWGLMFYFVPVILKKPIWSHSLSLAGFWGLAFFYPMNGVHHFLWSPIPMYVQSGVVVATIAVELVVTTVLVNFMMTLRGRWDMLRSNLPIRWFYTGAVNYWITCAQCAVQVLLSVQRVIHFSDWVVGHAHLVMFGVFGFWVIGFITELWPKLVGRPWHNPALNYWTYWLSTIGVAVMFLDLVAAGLVQGYLWGGLSTWEDSLIASAPFWWTRTASGALIIFGQALFLYNMWRTARAEPESAGAEAPVTA